MNTQVNLEAKTEFVEWFNQRWNNRMGAIDGFDVAFIGALLASQKSSTIVEIGCASGLSTAVIASLQEQISPARLTSFDIDDRFYEDRTKPVGYLIEEALPHPSVDVSIQTGKVSLDVGEHVSDPIDFCFIDAAHKHPWPLIDTLAVLPLMKPGGVVVQHDLKMFLSVDFYATGPKILLDQTPPKSQIRHGSVASVPEFKNLKTRGRDGNIYAIRVPEDYRQLGAKLCQGFYLGWDVAPSKKISKQFADRFIDFLSLHYGPAVARSFKIGMKRYNSPIRTPAPSSEPQGHATSISRKIVNKLTK